jgi:predicted HD phosphohydrolase
LASLDSPRFLQNYANDYHDALDAASMSSGTSEGVSASLDSPRFLQNYANDYHDALDAASMSSGTSEGVSG